MVGEVRMAQFTQCRLNVLDVIVHIIMKVNDILLVSLVMCKCNSAQYFGG